MVDLRRGDFVGRAYRRVVPRNLRHHVEYTRVHGRPPYLPWKEPSTFSGKVVWRIQNDRRDLLKPLCDKLAMKDLAAAAGVPTPATLWSGTDPEELAEASLGFPGRWVLKPNHASGLVRFVDGPVDAEAARRLTAGWTDIRFGTAHGEWAYQFARRLIIAEESLTPAGIDLPDYKFFTFAGEPVVALVIADRRGTQHTETYYRLPEWARVDARKRGWPTGDVPSPAELPQMLEAVEALGAGYDFVRVDLYARDGQVWLGELTPYPGIGLIRYDPRSFDEWLGDQWVLPSG